MSMRSGNGSLSNGGKESFRGTVTQSIYFNRRVELGLPYRFQLDVYENIERTHCTKLAQASPSPPLEERAGERRPFGSAFRLFNADRQGVFVTAQVSYHPG